MSTWISRAAAVSILVALPGCLVSPEVTRRAPQKITVADRSVIVAGPPGYCIDTAATRDSTTGAFVLLGSCASIAGNPNARTPTAPALLTASISPVSPALATASSIQLESFFRSASGRAALARDGRAGSVRILKIQQQGGALYIKARDISAKSDGGLVREYWRGIFDLGDRLVTVSVIGFADRPLSDLASLATLDAFAARIRAENHGMLASSTNPRLPG